MLLVQTCVRVRTGPRRWLPGYQPDCAVLLSTGELSDPPSPVLSVALSSSYGLFVLFVTLYSTTITSLLYPIRYSVLHTRM